MKKLLSTALAISLLAPVMVMAQALDITNMDSIGVAIGQVTNFISVLFVSIAVIFFIWGAFTFVTAGADEEKKSKSKSHMINSLIGIFLIISVWGIINLMLATLGTENIVNTAATTVDKNIVIPAL